MVMMFRCLAVRRKILSENHFEVCHHLIFGFWWFSIIIRHIVLPIKSIVTSYLKWSPLVVYHKLSYKETLKIICILRSLYWERYICVQDACVDQYSLSRMTWLVWARTLPWARTLELIPPYSVLKIFFFRNSHILSVFDYLLYVGLVATGSRYIGTLGKANFA
jgi:hypothetical protein